MSAKAQRAARDVQAKIAEMEQPDRGIAERIHAIVADAAPELEPRLWYSQPAWARGGRVVCFFRSGQVDREPYSTFGFAPEARLDDGSGLWPTSYAVTELNDDVEATIARLVRRAAG